MTRFFPSPSRPLRACLRLFAAVLVVLVFSRSQAQFKLGGAQGKLVANQGFRVPIFEKGTGENTQPQLRALITGGATLAANLTIVVQDMVIIIFGPDGSTNVVARASECLFNQAESTATSTNRLEVDAGQGQLRISGSGFLLNLTNSTLFLSNDVHTIIQASVVDAARRTKPTSAEQALQALPAAAANSTNPPILINSERLNLLALSNVVTYDGSVEVSTAQADLNCDTLTIQRATNGAVREIVADRNVVVRSRATSGLAFGNRGVYTTVQGGQLITLDGTPARWEDGPRLGRARSVVFDLENDVIQAEHDAFVRLPRQGLQKQDWILSEQKPGSDTASNLMVSIRAELLTLQLPNAFRQGHSVMAQTNVVVINEEDGGQAAADQALYAEVTGTVELTGNARFNSADRIITADSVFLDRSNRTFRASGNAYLHLPLGALGRRATLPTIDETDDNAERATALEVYCRRYHYREGVLYFEEEVRAHLLEADRVTTRLNCEELVVHGTNRLDQVYALRQVHLEQLPVTAPSGKTTQRSLDCQWLALFVDTNGHPDRVIARTNVLANEYVMAPSQPEPILTRLGAQEVTAEFMQGTNQFKRVLAERDVTVTQGLRSASGQMALLENNLLRLTGQPTLVAPEGRVRDAAAINYDLISNQFSIEQGRIEGEGLPKKLNFQR